MFKLMLLMAMGLGAMYMMHLLAQDYNKIRQPVAVAARALAAASNTVARVRRDNSETITKVYKWLNIQEQQLSNENTTNTSTTLSIDWKRILSRDPFECLLSLICQLMSGAETNSHEAKLLKDFVESTVAQAPAKIGHAFSIGLALYGATDRCYDEYPFCVYSAKTMLRVLRWFVETPSEDEV